MVLQDALPQEYDEGGDYDGQWLPTSNDSAWVGPGHRQSAIRDDLTSVARRIGRPINHAECQALVEARDKVNSTIWWTGAIGIFAGGFVANARVKATGLNLVDPKQLRQGRVSVQRQNLKPSRLVKWGFVYSIWCTVGLSAVGFVNAGLLPGQHAFRRFREDPALRDINKDAMAMKITKFRWAASMAENQHRPEKSAQLSKAVSDLGRMNPAALDINISDVQSRFDGRTLVFWSLIEAFSTSNEKSSGDRRGNPARGPSQRAPPQQEQRQQYRGTYQESGENSPSIAPNDEERGGTTWSRLRQDSAQDFQPSDPALAEPALAKWSEPANNGSFNDNVAPDRDQDVPRSREANNKSSDDSYNRPSQNAWEKLRRSGPTKQNGGSDLDNSPRNDGKGGDSFF